MEFGAVSRTDQNPPWSKPWAVAQAFSSKSADFEPLKILSKSSRETPETLIIALIGVWETYNGV